MKRNKKKQEQKMVDIDSGRFVVVEPSKMMAVKKIRFNKDYQRGLERARILVIVNSIKKYGYWPGEVIYLNDVLEVVDGQHRVMAAIRCGVDMVNVCILSFVSKEVEAEFFIDRNMHSTALSPRSFWHAALIAGHPLAKLIYALEQDDLSFLKGRIAIKGVATEKSKFSIPSVLAIFIATVLGVAGHYKKKEDAYFVKRLGEYTYEEVRDRMNVFVEWFTNCFGEYKRINPDPYRARSILAILAVYILLKKKGAMRTPGGRDGTVVKYRTFIFTASFHMADRAGQIMSLVSHYNKGKKSEHTRIKYEG